MDRANKDTHKGASNVVSLHAAKQKRSRRGSQVKNPHPNDDLNRLLDEIESLEREGKHFMIF